MECENEACDGCKKDYLLIHGKGVLSFFKFSPPKFARSASHLTDQETYLEDSSGQRWRVTVCNHHSSLSIQQGWPKFISDHGLDLGDFLVFHYVPGQHFIVKMFGPNGCEKKKSCSDIGNGRKRARTYPEATTPSELFQTLDINLVEKKSRKSDESESEKVADKPNITDFATNIDAETGKAQSVHSAINVDESFCVIDRNSQYDQEDDRLCLDLSSLKCQQADLLKGDTGKDNHVETNLRSQDEPNLNAEIGNLNSEALLSKLEAGITATNMVSRPAEDIPLPGPKYKKSNEASQFADHLGHSMHELQESWRKHLLKRAKQERMIIYLRGPDTRIWPTFYHCRLGFNVSISGWKQVTAAYGKKPGDDCLFQLVDQQKCVFDVCKI